MAVFTHVSEESARELVTRWPAGEFRSIKPITAGIENTNYFVDTDHDLPFYLSYMEHLGRKGCTVARPLRTIHGDLFDHVGEKPAILTNRLAGDDGSSVGPAGCASMGETLARMHLAVADFGLRQENPRGLHWWIETIPKILPIVPE